MRIKVAGSVPTAHYTGTKSSITESPLSSDYRPGAQAFAHNPLMRWLMTKNSCNDKIGMRFLIFGVLIGCALLAAGAMADVQNVTVVTVEPGFPGVNAYDITFNVEVGLSAGVNAIFVTFDQNTTVPADLANHPECITVTSEQTGASGHPSLVWILDEDTETGECDRMSGNHGQDDHAGKYLGKYSGRG